MAVVSDASVIVASLALIMSLCFWIYLFVKKFPGFIQGIKDYFMGEKVIMKKEAEESEGRLIARLQLEVDKLRDEALKSEGRFIEGLKTELATIKKDAEETQTKFVEGLKTELEGQKKAIGDYARDEVAGWIMTFVGDMINPQTEESRAISSGLFNSLIVRGYDAMKDNPKLKEKIEGKVASMLDDFSGMLFNHLKEHPEILKEVVASWKEAGAKVGGGGIGGMLAMMGIKMPGMD